MISSWILLDKNWLPADPAGFAGISVMVKEVVGTTLREAPAGLTFIDAFQNRFLKALPPKAIVQLK
jgi:hypothetical protein